MGSEVVHVVADRSDLFTVGRFAVEEDLRQRPGWKAPRTVADAEALNVGDLVCKYGFESVWTRRHLKPSQLEALRQVGDDVADAVIRAFADTKKSGGVLLTHIEANRDHPAAKAFLAATTHAPDWLDWSKLRQAQRFWAHHSVVIGECLLHLSLIGGFSAPRINKVLNSTAYLSKEPSKTYRRLLETLQMVVDLMDDDALVAPSGAGWRSVLSVRLLHAAVRVRIMDAEPCGDATWDLAAWGVPINQEDLIATQLAFSQVVIMGMERVPVIAPLDDLNAWLHLWRFVGHLMGIEPANNRHMGSVFHAKTMLESITLHVVHPDEVTMGMVTHMLQSVHMQPPAVVPATRHAQVVQALAGLPFSYALGLRPSVMRNLEEMEDRTMTVWQKARAKLRPVWFAFLVMRLISKLASMPVVGRWVVAFKARFLRAMIAKGLGKPATQFTLKHPPHLELLHGVEDKFRLLAGSPTGLLAGPSTSWRWWPAAVAVVCVCVAAKVTQRSR